MFQSFIIDFSLFLKISYMYTTKYDYLHPPFPPTILSVPGKMPSSNFMSPFFLYNPVVRLMLSVYVCAESNLQSRPGHHASTWDQKQNSHPIPLRRKQEFSLNGFKAYPHPRPLPQMVILNSKDLQSPMLPLLLLSERKRRWCSKLIRMSGFILNSLQTTSSVQLQHTLERDVRKKGAYFRKVEQFSVLNFKYRRKSVLELRPKMHTEASFTDIRKFSVPIKDYHQE